LTRWSTLERVKRRMVVAALAAVVAVVLLVALLVKVRREREWAHGGDAVRTDVRVRLADADGLPEALVALGGTRKPAYLPDGTQAVVVQVVWRGPAHKSGSYQVIALDKRVTPARQLDAYYGWNSSGETGSGWAGSYRVLAQRYAWLAGTAPVRTPSGEVQAMAIGGRATVKGEITASFLVGDGSLVMDDPARDLLVALFFDDGSGVRWAKRITG
jgi:hypothetical protein